MRTALLLVALGLAASRPAWALDLAVAGAWSLPVTAANLAAGAGSGLPASRDSGASEILIDVTDTTGVTDRWQLEVRRTDATWHPDLRVWVRRRGDGSGAGTIADGAVWIELDNTNTVLCTGSGDRTDIPVQLRVSGLSLSVSPDVYLAALQYTLVDVP